MRRHIPSTLLILCLCATSLVGTLACTTTPSNFIATEAIFFQFRVTREGDVLTARAVFRVGSALGSLLELSDTDSIEVNGVALDESRDPLTNFLEYTATVPDSAEYVFTFSRADEPDYTSRVTVPPAVEITAPLADTSISRAANFEVTWTPSGSAGIANVLVTIPCVEIGLLKSGDNDGQQIVEADDLEIDPSLVTEVCDDASAQLSIVRTGTLDADLNGVITGESSDSVSFVSEP